MGKISEHLGELVEQGAERSVTIYDPDKGLKTIDVAGAVEKNLKRVWRQTNDPLAREQLEKAIDIKIDEQVAYLVFRNGAVTPSQQDPVLRGKRVGVAALGPPLPPADPGKRVIGRWNKRFCTKANKQSPWEPDAEKIALRKGDAKHRAIRICEQEKDGVIRGTEGTGEIERYTPTEYIEVARQMLGAIDLDPASCEVAQQTVQATEYFTLADDGLRQEWHGRVWLNPPYHRKLLPAFIDKLITEIKADRITAAIMVTNNSTDTDWFNAAARVCQGICFTYGRIQFEPEDVVGPPTQGQTFFYFGPDVQRFEDVFCMIGLCVRPSRQYERIITTGEENQEEQYAQQA